MNETFVLVSEYEMFSVVVKSTPKLTTQSLRTFKQEIANKCKAR